MGLQTRLLLIAALVLSACLGAVGWIQDRSFKGAVRNGAADQLRAVAYGLLAAADDRDGQLVMAPELGEPRLSQPNSGLYAYLEGSNGATIWRSPSIIASGSRISELLPIGKRPAPGEQAFGLAAPIVGEPPRFVLGYTVFWESLGSQLTFWVLADEAPYHNQIVAFRRDAVVGLLAAAATFLVIQFAALRWGLRPVRRMATRLRGLEAGKRDDIGNDYPSELAALARNLNRFIASEKANRDRHRNAMDDLAHSLKTPLAVLKNALRELRGGQARLFEEQLRRMETTVSHQLGRASAVRPTTQSLAVMPVATRIARALERAYAQKSLAIELIDESPAAVVRVDERDLMEMLGNLIDNAFKYGRSRIRISASPQPTAQPDGGQAGRPESVSLATILVEDDGPGIAADRRQRVLQRGERGDMATSGQGIGLAMVVELAAFYQGCVHIGDSDLGGAALRLSLPTPSAT